jgi:putative hydrolase of the HAD superfamily
MGDFGKIEAVVFDMDDTLYSQASFKESGFRAVAAHLEREGVVGTKGGGVVTEALAAIMKSVGPSHPRMLNMMVEKLKLEPALIHEMVQVFREHKPDLAPYPGVVGLLEELQGRFKLGLLTDGLKEVQAAKLEALGIAQYFDEVVLSDEYGMVKPDERLFMLFEERFGLPPEKLAYIADNPAKDFIGATGRGWLTVRVLTGEHAGIKAADGYAASYEIETLERLPALLL